MGLFRRFLRICSSYFLPSTNIMPVRPFDLVEISASRKKLSVSEWVEYINKEITNYLWDSEMEKQTIEIGHKINVHGVFFSGLINWIKLKFYFAKVGWRLNYFSGDPHMIPSCLTITLRFRT